MTGYEILLLVVVAVAAVGGGSYYLYATRRIPNRMEHARDHSAARRTVEEIATDAAHIGQGEWLGQYLRGENPYPRLLDRRAMDRLVGLELPRPAGYWSVAGEMHREEREHVWVLDVQDAAHILNELHGLIDWPVDTMTSNHQAVTYGGTPDNRRTVFAYREPAPLAALRSQPGPEWRKGQRIVVRAETRDGIYEVDNVGPDGIIHCHYLRDAD